MKTKENFKCSCGGELIYEKDLIENEKAKRFWYCEKCYKTYTQESQLNWDWPAGIKSFIDDIQFGLNMYRERCSELEDELDKLQK